MKENVKIGLQNDAPNEQRMKAVLEHLLEWHDLEPWLFTRAVRIDENGMPHSHPVLTLNAECFDETTVLAEFVHEQLHWFEEEHADARDRAIEETKLRYPAVPVARPEGAGSEDSTRLHLIVCYLEFQALKLLLGKEKARAQIETLSRHHYCWVYRTVLEDETLLADIVRHHNLYPEPLRAQRS